MNKSAIAPACAQDLLDSATNAAVKGQAQWFTPRAWAQLLATPLPRHRPVIVDLTCGRGDLLLGCSNKSTKARLGCDIDSQAQILFAHEHFIGADLTALLPLLHEVAWRADLFVINPPWDLHWHRERLASLAQSRVPAVRAAFKAIDPRLGRDTMDSTIATLALALDACSDVGEGFLIANASTVERLIFGPSAPHAALRDHVWAVVTVDGNICELAAHTNPRFASQAEGQGEGATSSFRTAVLYFALGHTSGVRQRIHMSAQPEPRAWLNAAARRMESIGRWQREGPEIHESYLHTDDTEALWSAVRDEWRSLQADRTSRLSRYNIRLDGAGVIRTHLSLFEQHSIFIDKGLAAELHEMNGKRPMQLVLQRAQRDALLAVIGEESPWKVDPQLATAVAQAIQQYHAQRAPLYPLPEIQRLGYLDEEDTIQCKADFPAPLPSRAPHLFSAGQAYPIATRTVTVRRKAERIGLNGEPEDIEYTGAELCILITDDNARQWSFMEQRLRTDKVRILGLSRDGREPVGPQAGKGKNRPPESEGMDARECIDFSLQELVAHFKIPSVPDVAAVDPAGYERNLSELEAIEALCQQ